MNSQQLDQAITQLQSRKEQWATLPIAKKLAYLRELVPRADKIAAGWVAAATDAKGIPSDSPWVGEEWLSGPYAVLYGINCLVESLEALERGETPGVDPNRVRTRSDGQVIVQVAPADWWESVLLSGVKAEVWMDPEVSAATLAASTATRYREPTAEDNRGKVALVLGAGNIASIAPLDVLHKLYAEGQVCLLKMNPINEYLGPFFEDLLEPLIEAGYLHICYGGADVGAYLTDHSGIDEIHMTGSGRTHDAIVFGTGSRGEDRKRRGELRNDKRMTSELGGVGPTIVLPGPWSAADIRFQAEHLVTQKMHNGGFNCIASQVLILPSAWEQRAEFLRAVRLTLQQIEPRYPYYPGAAQRQAAAVERFPQAELLDSPERTPAPRTLILDLEPDGENGSDYCFREEFFGGVLAQTALPGAGAAEFLRNAIDFCNQRLKGTLGANIIAHPNTLRELGDQFEDALASLRYGSIGVNAWSGIGFLLCRTTWGAYPGHSATDIQSGVGTVHNTYFFDKPQKSVIYAPFSPFPRSLLHGELHLSPKPPWFVTHRQAHLVGKRLTRFAAKPGFRHLPGIFAAALRG